MLKFHFEIVDGYKIEDPVGLDCKSEEQARKAAKDIARQMPSTSVMPRRATSQSSMTTVRNCLRRQ
jgi:hypothetical protein